jgi:hypothetical protein
MNDRAIVVAALIVGGAIVAASFQMRSRYTLSAADSNVVWRMDTWSGQIDICAAAYLPTGPVVRCGARIVIPEPGAAPTGAEPSPPRTPAAPLSSDTPRQDL